MNTRILLAVAVLLAGCHQSELVSEYTGNETSYALQQSSDFHISGTVTFKERKDGQVTAVVVLTGSSGTSSFPAHLHLGDLTNPGADVALLMNPVDAKTGRSETKFSKLSNETAVTYQSLVNLEACVKIHLSDTGDGRNIILAAGNIGTAVSKVSGGRFGVAVCDSE